MLRVMTWRVFGGRIYFGVLFLDAASESIWRGCDFCISEYVWRGYKYLRCLREGDIGAKMGAIACVQNI